MKKIVDEITKLTDEWYRLIGPNLYSEAVDAIKLYEKYINPEM